MVVVIDDFDFSLSILICCVSAVSLCNSFAVSIAFFLLAFLSLTFRQESSLVILTCWRFANVIEKGLIRVLYIV